MAFLYDPLPPKGHIRTLTVLPELSPQGLIQCTLRHTTISDEYICLSYAWGVPATLGSILINGVTVLVGYNLNKFLETARIEFYSQPLWIDAVCINQADDTEKSTQVQQMGPIFSSASKVIAWLGVSEQVTEFLEALQRIPGAYLSWTEFEQKEDIKFSVGEDIVLGSTEYWTLADRHREKIHALFNEKSISTDLTNAFVGAEYWKRAWITQEVVLARSLVLRTDRAQLDYAIVADRLAAGPHYLPHRRFEGGGLIQLLNQFRSMKCFLRRDRIFSLLGMCREIVQVDYGTSDVDVFLQTIRAVSEELCLCSAIVVSQGLEMKENDISLELQTPEFEICAKSAPLRTCCDRGHFIPGGWVVGKGVMFCLRSICRTEYVDMHFFLQETSIKGVFSVWSHDPYMSIEDLHAESMMGSEIDANVHVWVETTMEEAESSNNLYRLRFGLRVLIFLARRGAVPDHGEIKKHGRLLRFINI